MPCWLGGLEVRLHAEPLKLGGPRAPQRAVLAYPRARPSRRTPAEQRIVERYLEPLAGLDTTAKRETGKEAAA
jgi:hypothetical protein